MARVTVEDCVEKLPDRFELVLIAAQRARKIGTGAVLTIDRDNDKNPVVALREIAEETLSIDTLKEDLTRSYQRVILSDEEDRNMIELKDSDDTYDMRGADSGIYAEADEDDDEDFDALESMAGDVDDED